MGAAVGAGVGAGVGWGVVRGVGRVVGARVGTTVGADGAAELEGGADGLVGLEPGVVPVGAGDTSTEEADTVPNGEPEPELGLDVALQPTTASATMMASAFLVPGPPLRTLRI